LDDGCVDGLITVNTVYFIRELDAACAELARVLRPGGRAVIGIGDPEVMVRLPFTKHGFTIRPVGRNRCGTTEFGPAGRTTPDGRQTDAVLSVHRRRA
jgi:arsenite methyltransferase